MITGKINLIATNFAERVLVILRDGRHLVGILRSFDQFSNFIMENTVERRYVDDIYGDIPLVSDKKMFGLVAKKHFYFQRF